MTETLVLSRERINQLHRFFKENNCSWGEEFEIEFEFDGQDKLVSTKHIIHRDHDFDEVSKSKKVV